MSPRTVDVAANTLGRSAMLRSSSLWLVTTAGRCRRWLRSGWRPLVAVYILSAVILALHHLLNERDPLARFRAAIDAPLATFASVAIWFFHGSAGPWLVAFGVTAILAALWVAWKVRQTVVILDFANVTGDDQNKAVTAGLARRLMTEISEIAHIFATVSNDPPEFAYGEEANQAPKLVVDGATDAFSGLKASLAGSKVQVGILSLPLDAIFNAVSTLVRGPRLVGSLQKTDQGLLLEASLEQNGTTTAWRVSSADAEVTGDKAMSPDAVPAIVRQMAYRVFTHVQQAQLGTPIWRAIRCYTDALRASRDAARDKQRQLVYLRRAQRGFFNAYREDQQFIRSLYNLGVICYSQREFIAAYAIFRDAEDKLASRPSSVFGATRRSKAAALAGLHYASAKAAQGASAKAAQGAARDWIERVAGHCRKAIELFPDHALAWNLLGVESFNPDVARLYFRHSAALAWWNLCQHRFQGSESPAPLRTANLTLTNLAATNFDKRSGMREIKQAIRLDPGHPENELLRGQIHLRSGQRAAAFSAFESASVMRESSDIWFWIAIAHALSGDRGQACTSFRRAIEDPNFAPKGELPVSQLKALASVCPGTGGKVPDFLAEELQWLENVRVEKDESKLRALSDATNGDDWRRAQVQLALALLNRQRYAQRQPDAKDPEQFLSAATEQFEEARRLLEPRVAQCAPEFGISLIRDRFNARANSREPNLTTPDALSTLDALIKATGDALRYSPSGANERYLLAQSFLALQLNDPALDELENSLSVKPDFDDPQITIVNVALNRFQKITDANYRRSMIKQAVDILRDLAEVEESRIWGLDRNFIGYIHHWLGRLSYELLDFKTAQSSLEIAFACGFLPFANLSQLCVIHFRAGAYEEAELAYERINRLADASIVAQTAALEEDVKIEFWLAWVANHTAGSRAEQGSNPKIALQRWLEGRKLQRGLDWLQDDQRRAFAAGQLLALGAILLSDSLNATGLWARSRPRKVAKSEIETAKSSRRVRRLKTSLMCFQRAITKNVDSAIRADCLYRMAVAYSALAEADAAGATSWRAQALDALDSTTDADRRTEYATRISSLRAKLAQTKAS
jgi:tetratricopeptide (TPR) repeat protein